MSLFDAPKIKNRSAHFGGERENFPFAEVYVTQVTLPVVYLHSYKRPRGMHVTHDGVADALNALESIQNQQQVDRPGGRGGGGEQVH